MRKFLSRLLTRLMKSWGWVLVILLTILIKWVSLYPAWVENNYTYGVYPVISRTQRFLLGWIPFSIGDLFYAVLLLSIIYKTVQFFKILFRKQFTRRYFIRGLQQVIFVFLFIYVSFNLLWGLNYNRRGISSQLGMEVKRYSIEELDTLTSVIVQHLNDYSELVTPEQRQLLKRKKFLFDESTRAYHIATARYSFLSYTPVSVKPSLFSYLGNYLGFQGYYNPFSGEGQVNTTVPLYLQPFVTVHEIAHQIGYGKENEANFVGFLAARYGGSVVLKYSMYLDMYGYAIREVFRRDARLFSIFQHKLKPQVVNDIKEYNVFFRRYQNPVEPVVTWFYGHYLKANNQPAGKQTYNEVVAWLIAYYKKFGVTAL